MNRMSTDTACTAYVSLAVAPVCGFAVFILLARANDTQTLTTGIAFEALTLFLLLDIPIVSIADAAEEFMAVVNCCQRIQDYLLEKERVDHRVGLTLEEPSLLDQDPSGTNTVTSCVKARDLSVAWSIDDEPILKNLTFNIDLGKITMIVGPVGCGKSTLLKTLLGEVAERSGSIAVGFGNSAYCSQSPWITFGTIQQNIVGASSWDQKWYDRVIQACSLQFDLQQLPEGDQTKVGVHGSRLSGGQQMRVVSWALSTECFLTDKFRLLHELFTPESHVLF